MKVLAIDPGFGRCGVAVLEGTGSNPSLLYSSCIETEPKSPHTERLLAVAEEVEKLIDIHTPETVVLEELFFTNNAKTALQVAEIRGILIYLATTKNIPVVEYNPLSVKIALTGYGRATKEQVTLMVKKILSLSDKKMLDDEYDAIALGITALAQARHTELNR